MVVVEDVCRRSSAGKSNASPALLFYKRINDVYLENVAALEAEVGDPELARDPRMHDFVAPEDRV